MEFVGMVAAITVNNGKLWLAVWGLPAIIQLMKRLPIPLALCVLLFLGERLHVQGQGVVDFNNMVSSEARIRSQCGNYLEGPDFKVDLFYGFVGNDPSTFTSLGLAVDFGTGLLAGYFWGGPQAIPGFAAGTQVAIQPRAWLGTSALTYWNAFASGMPASMPSYAPVVNVTLVNSSGLPMPPSKLAGYPGDTIWGCPEPSSLGLGIVFAAGFFVWRRYFKASAN